METRSVVVEREFAYPPEKVWRALTEGSLMKEWLMENDFEPTVGHRFSFRSAPVPGWDGVIGSQVLVIEAEKKLSYTWCSMGLESVIVWTLEGTGGGTKVRMEHSGFGVGQDAAYKGAGYGWQRFVGRLEQVLAGLGGD